MLERLRRALAAHYEVQRLLGQGGMGAVFLGRDLTLDRPVAIKVISAEIAGAESSRARFLQEARVVANLRHPNIVAVHSAGEIDGQLYFVMEYVPGESLRDLMTRVGALDADTTSSILQSLALALDYAHSQGVVHRDVKPENILLDRDTGRAMLTDFGVARAFQRDVALTGTGTVLGSPRYMSPEQATAETNIDGRSDLYALALIGHEMLRGAPAFDASSVAGMLIKHLTEMPAPVAQIARDVPPGLADAIDRGSRKAPEERWASGRAMAEAIGLPLPSGAFGAASGSFRAPNGTSRGKRRFALTAVGVLVAVLAAGGWFWQQRAADASTQSFVVLPFDVQGSARTAEHDVTWLREGSVSMLTMAMSQWIDLAVADYERTLDLVRDVRISDGSRISLNDAREIARRANAGSLVMGQVTATNDSILVVARVYDTRRGKLWRTVSQTALASADPRPLYDRLAQRLLIGVDSSAGASGALSAGALTRMTTTSIGAYRDYVDGMRALKRWDLLTADSLFLRAIRQDSTFALAYFKRAMTLGWSDAGGTELVVSAERAAALSDRLPPRERRMVQGHLLLTRGLSSQRTGDADVAVRSLHEAASIYGALAATDSLSADVWYEYGDAQYHLANMVPAEEGAALATAALRSFGRALALDPEFHLAYAHQVNLLLNHSRAGNYLLVEGDSIVPRDSIGDAARVRALREAGTARAREVAQQWVNSDPAALEAHEMLAQSFAQQGRFDSAAAAYQRGAAKAGPRAQRLRLQSVLMSGLGGATTFRDSLAAVAADNNVLRLATSTQRTQAMGGAMSGAAAAGDGALLTKLAKRWIETDTTIAGSPFTTAQTAAFMLAGLRVAMGAPVTASMKREILAEARAIDAIKNPGHWFPRQSGQRIALMLFIASRDFAFADIAERWIGNPIPEIAAYRALAQGDSAAARALISQFPSADSTRMVGISFAGLRSLLRAELVAEMGDTRNALAYYEAIAPERFTFGFVDPGLAYYVRSFAKRGRLFEHIGERARAIASYEEYLRRWAVDDPITAAERRQVQQRLAELRR